MQKHPGHEKHLCKLIVGDLIEIEKIKPLVDKGRYICIICGRVANNSENLCDPTSIQYSTDLTYSGA